MKATGFAGIAWRDLAATRARSLISAAGISLGVAVLMVVVGLGLGARDVVLREVVRQLPIDTIEVVPRTVSLGWFKVGSGALFGGEQLDEKTLERLRSLPGVSAAYPKLEVKIPMGARGGARLFGRRLYTDLFMTALPPEIVQPEAGDDFKETPGIVPVVISDQLIEIYNTSVASALGTPQLTPEALEGFEFEIVFGRSLMLGNRGAKRTGVERGRIVGVSRYAIRLGITVPLETAQRLLREYGEPNEGDHEYAAILLQAESPADIPAITRAVIDAGLAVDETAERTADIMNIATLLASLVGLLVLALAALNIAHLFFASLSEQRRDLAILRAVGARQLHLVGLVLTQAVLLGLFGGVAGIALAHLGTWVIDVSAGTLLPDFPFKPESFFSMPLWLDAAALGAAVSAAAVGALWPAVRAARVPLARALSDL
ncbi:MAG: FtsX-like permease family protein [Myxococcota bacterium]